MADALSIYRTAVPTEFFFDLRKASGLRAEGGVYTAQVTAWAMMRQRLDAKGTLNTAVAEVTAGRPKALLPTHKRLTEGTLSAETSSYSEARKRLGVEVVNQVADRIFSYLQQASPEAVPGLGRQAFLMDGSSLTLPATPELLKAYPPSQNTHGVSHWPVLKLVVATDLVSGIAMRPSWGPMYGKQAASEQSLAKASLDQLPAGAVLVYDRNFGIFSSTHDATKRDHPVVVRLTDARARCILKGKLPQDTDERVEWKPSRWDLAHHPELKAGDCVRGRVIAMQVTRQGRSIQIYFFTTLDLSPEQIAELYGYRWNIETDLRSLKETVHLHSLTAKSVDMVAKELVLGIAAYNLVRGTMVAAAHVAGINPRQLSFSRVQDVVNSTLPSLAAATDSPQEYQRLLDRMLRRAAQCKLPQRKRPRPSYPREVWPRGGSFPHRKSS